MDWLTAAVTILTQGWPVAAITVAVLFRKDLATLLPRVKKAGPLELDVREQKQALGELPVSNVPKPLPGVANTPAIEASERLVRQGLERISNAERVDWLARALAEMNLIVAFERIYRVILGSQIAALKFINANPNTSSNSIKNFYENAANSFPAVYQKFPFEQWIDYLRISGLATDQGGRWNLTDNGIEFLRYLVTMRLPEEKYG